MMSTLIYICLLGVFSYHCSAIDKEFRGSSGTAKLLTGLAGGFGYLAYYGTLIWSFWKFDWWLPILTFVIGIIIGTISAIFFQRNVVGMILSPILVVVFAILSIVGLA